MSVYKLVNLQIMHIGLIDWKCSEALRKEKYWRSSLNNFGSSMEVGYGFYAIRSKLLIANDMSWVVL